MRIVFNTFNAFGKNAAVDISREEAAPHKTRIYFRHPITRRYLQSANCTRTGREAPSNVWECVRILDC